MGEPARIRLFPSLLFSLHLSLARSQFPLLHLFSSPSFSPACFRSLPLSLYPSRHNSLSFSLVLATAPCPIRLRGWRQNAPLSSQLATHKTAKARFWTWLEPFPVRKWLGSDETCPEPQKPLRGGIPCSFLEPFVGFCGEISSKVDEPCEN